ncbi:glycosyltransferase [Streptomyces sp. NPDC059272]|uniref:glycosyltransferase n=1 Tax=Streptomyces sp. NPDC059272 TaxID=3346800 RepID=UPI003690D6C0
MIPAAVAVVVPAHNEEDRIGACLRSVRRAAAQVAPLPVVTVVAADACTDATAAVAARAGAHVVRLEHRSVGAARAAGTAHALHLLAGGGRPVWLAMTDADTTVPDTWLTDQIDWARQGHDVVLGTIRLAGGSRRLTALHDARYFRTRPAGTGEPWSHPHVHGANLGLSPTAYLRVGGFAALPTGEDRDLVSRLAAQGHRIARTDRHPVRTAARLRGRAPDGLADLLATLRPAVWDRPVPELRSPPATRPRLPR